MHYSITRQQYGKKQLRLHIKRPTHLSTKKNYHFKFSARIVRWTEEAAGRHVLTGGFYFEGWHPAGKPLKERVKGANFEPGGIQEHHGFYHPGYMGWTIAYQAYAQLMDDALPESQRDHECERRGRERSTVSSARPARSR